MIRRHVKPQLGRGRRMSNEMKGTLAGWLAGWLRGRRFTCKQSARALRFTRNYGVRRRRGGVGYVYRWTKNEARAGKKEQNAPAAQNTFGRRWMMFLQKRVEHVFLCCVLRVNRARKRGRRFTCKQNARALRFTRN